MLRKAKFKPHLFARKATNHLPVKPQQYNFFLKNILIVSENIFPSTSYKLLTNLEFDLFKFKTVSILIPTKLLIIIGRFRFTKSRRFESFFIALESGTIKFLARVEALRNN